ncbi:futalosine hydrolase [Streptomyces sp. N2-109]|uniref:Futalosine hydrolase n=1 Tax=Streptomyces gossypii TaxID=2883101 RepID=A0ABT2JZS6_9ACTN|nr:futalosine hydrolase [Streptomyces gossypii]MCT2592734.1 futalosine hydrolase [Streptomyces gossypii]
MIVTAVAAERDAVTRVAPAGAPGDVVPLPLPGSQVLHRVRYASAPGAASATGAGDVLADVLAAGVGPAAASCGAATALTAAALAGAPYDLVVSAGIGGGIVRTEAAVPSSGPGPGPGTVVVATAVVAADLGAEAPDGFRPVTELGFGTVRHLPPEALVQAVAMATGALTGEVLTVSTVTGTAERAAELAARHPRAAAEAMEGFGVAEAAAAHGVPVLEIRAVSNAVGPRDRAAWRIPEALRALTSAFGMMVPALGNPASWKTVRTEDE